MRDSTSILNISPMNRKIYENNVTIVVLTSCILYKILIKPFMLLNRFIIIKILKKVNVIKKTKRSYFNMDKRLFFLYNYLNKSKNATFM